MKRKKKKKDEMEEKVEIQEREEGGRRWTPCSYPPPSGKDWERRLSHGSGRRSGGSGWVERVWCCGQGVECACGDGVVVVLGYGRGAEVE